MLLECCNDMKTYPIRGNTVPLKLPLLVNCGSYILVICLLSRYQGYISAALVLGGVDYTGPHLYTIYPHGSTDKLPFVTMGMYNFLCVVVLLERNSLD